MNPTSHSLLPRVLLCLLVCLQMLAPMLHAHAAQGRTMAEPAGLHIHLAALGGAHDRACLGLTEGHAHASAPIGSDAVVEALVGPRADSAPIPTSTPEDAFPPRAPPRHGAVHVAAELPDGNQAHNGGRAAHRHPPAQAPPSV